MSDDDWFERALQEAEESDGTDEDDGDGATQTAERTGSDASTTDATDAGGESEASEAVGADELEAAWSESGDPFGDSDAGSDAEDPFGDPDSGSDADDPFGDPDSGSDADDPFGDTDSGSDDDDPFGDPDSGSDAEDPFGDPDAEADDDDPFGQSFADAFQSAPSPGGVDDAPDDGGAGESGSTLGGGSSPDLSGGGGPDFGGDGTPDFGDDGTPDFGGDGTPDFGGASGSSFEGPYDDEEDDLNSDLDRIDIGIEGLDNMIRGGVPVRSLMVALGSAGTGKTTFGLQFINEGMDQGARAVYITLEETRKRVLDSAEEKGWPFREYEQAGLLAVVDLDPIDMANSLTSIRNDLPRLIEDFGAERLVLDSVSLLEMMYDKPSRRRGEIFEFSRALKEAGVTTMVTSEASDSSAYSSRYGIIEYLSDAVFVLQYVRPNDFQETRLAIEIQKIRDASHSRQPKPYEISDEGISVHQQANLF